MNKVKSKKTAMKRIKISAGGKMSHRSQLQNHLKNSKSAKRVRRQQEPKTLRGANVKVLKKLMPYS